MAIESYYIELIELYDNLRVINENFLINNGEEENLTELVTQRSFYLDNINSLKNGLIDELRDTKLDIDYDSLELFDILRELPKTFTNLSNLKDKLIESLKKLIESEKNVSENMTNLRDDLKKELSQARTSKKNLNAYKPTNGYGGSHFIDRTR